MGIVIVLILIFLFVVLQPEDEIIKEDYKKKRDYGTPLTKK